MTITASRLAGSVCTSVPTRSQPSTGVAGGRPVSTPASSAVCTVTRANEPMLALMTFCENRSAQSGESTTRSSVNQSAMRRRVPTLPGSCTPSSARVSPRARPAAGRGCAPDPADRQHVRRRGKMAGARHLGDREQDRRGSGGDNRCRWRPSFRRVDFLEGEIRGEQFTDDLGALDHEQAQRLAVLFFAEGTEALQVGLGGHEGG
jgi:hypothetical protein